MRFVSRTPTSKWLQQKGLVYSAEKLAEREYSVRFTVGEAVPEREEKAEACAPDTRTDTVVVIASDQMGRYCSITAAHLTTMRVRQC